jgi:sigma-B regulation protein RsbU (phosphoserine phosphatase)
MTGTGRGRGPGPSLARRLDLITALIVALFIVVAVLVGANLVALRNDMRTDQRQAVPALVATDRLLTALIAQQAGVRGYLLGRTEDLITPYRLGQEEQSTQELRLHDLLQSDPTGRRYLSALDDAVSTWQIWASQALAYAAQAPSIPATVQQQQAAESRTLFVSIRNRQDRLSTYLQDKALHARDKADGARIRLAWFFVGSLIVSAIFLVLARVLFGRWIAAPLARISRQVAAVPASGEADPLPQQGPRELAALTTEIDALRSRLRQQLLETERAMEALRQRGPAVVALREQLLPQLPIIPGLDASCELAPAEGLLAGDWGDLVDLGDGRWALMLLDVSGHGAQAGILALRLKQLFVPALRDGRSPEEVFAWSVDSIGEWEEQFATALIVAGRTDDPRIRYANAGHPEPLLCTPDGVRRLPPTGPLLSGETRRFGWTSDELTLGVGDRLATYTDGIPEARDEQGSEFGVDRLQQLVCSARSPAESVRETINALREHQPVSRDDATLIVLDRRAIAQA